VASLFKDPKKWFKSAGNKLKQTVKGAAKIVSKVAPIAAVIPGVGTAVAAVAGGIGGKLSKALGKGGKIAQTAAAKLSKVQKKLNSTQSGAPQPVMAQPPPEALTTVEQPEPATSNPSFETPETSSSNQPQPAGMDPKMLLIAGGALLAIILLTRKR